MEQIGDIIERVLQDVEDKKIRKNRSFSEAGMAEICHLHERLLANLRLGHERVPRRPPRDAQKLLEEKARFRDLEREYAGSPPRPAAGQHRREHRDQLAAPGPDQRPEAHQLAHLLDRLPPAGVLSQTRHPQPGWLNCRGTGSGRAGTMALTARFAAVLFGALLHASWNALIKGGSDKALDYRADPRPGAS